MPPKPVPEEVGSGSAFYNIDFSLETQLRIATGAPPPPNPGSVCVLIAAVEASHYY